MANITINLEGLESTLTTAMVRVLEGIERTLDPLGGCCVPDGDQCSELSSSIEFTILSLYSSNNYNCKIKGPCVPLFREGKGGAHTLATLMAVQRYCGNYYYNSNNLVTGDSYTTPNGDKYMCTFKGKQRIVLDLLERER